MSDADWCKNKCESKINSLLDDTTESVGGGLGNLGQGVFGGVIGGLSPVMLFFLGLLLIVYLFRS